MYIFYLQFIKIFKIDKDIVKIADTSPGVEPMLLDKPSLDED